MLRLVIPSKEDKAAALDFREEFFRAGETVINGSGLLDRADSYEDWLRNVTANAGENAPWVRTDTYFAVDGSGRIVGIIDLRHELKGFLVDFGHAGYSVRPSERRKGYATEMLALLLCAARKAGLPSLQLSVGRSNAPSVRTIVKNGGRYERSFEFEGAPADVYRIALAKEADAR